MLIAKSIDYYKSIGYKYVEVPWVVSDEAICTTLNKSSYDEKNRVVGSAEQSFIQLMIDKDIKPGSYVACTPCFRDELIINNVSYPYFLKVELIIVDKYDIDKCLNDAKGFFINYNSNVIPLKTDNGYDLMLNDIEIGSYGVRKYKDYVWTYGTGLAEPRFSVACNKVK
jgi:hypothetical protein